MGAHLAKMSTRTASGAPPPSATFILTSSGHIYTTTTVASSLPSADLLILNLSSTPLRNPTYTLPIGASAPASTVDPAPPVPRLRTLPLSPYPAPVGTPIACLAYTNPARKDDEAPPAREWTFGRVTEYRDRAGREAKVSLFGVAYHRHPRTHPTPTTTTQTGTYDDLALMHMTTLPRHGSSGGPLVDVDSGAVVGIIRGSTHAYGDRAARGFATPAERVFELFQLPGFKPKSLQRGAERVKEGRESSKGSEGKGSS